MACSACSGVPQKEMMRAENSYVTDGGYLTQSHPGTDWYKGRHEGKVIYVVARNTEWEKLFPRTQLAEASDYARSIWAHINHTGGTGLENIPCVQMATDAVIAVYG